MCEIFGRTLMLCLLYLMIGCASTDALDARALEFFPPPGQLLDVGDKRLHIRCLGEDAGPTVIIETGAVASSVYWWNIQDRIAEFARVCTYDRAGLGWSDPAPNASVYALDDRVDDLHALLSQAGIEPRYILVGHSLGGLLARRYASSYPGEVAGVVLVDSAEEQFNLGSSMARADRTRLIRRLDLLVKGLKMGLPFVRKMSMFDIPNDAPPETAIALRASVFKAGMHELEAVNAVPLEMAKTGALGRLGDIPLIVISRGAYGPNESHFEIEWRAAQVRLLSLSSASEHMIAARSGHGIHVDEPEMIMAAVRKLLTQPRQPST